LPSGGGQADEIRVERGALGTRGDLRACEISLLAGRTAIGKGGDDQRVMLGVIGGVGLFVHLDF
jgi:hypothetical protein